MKEKANHPVRTSEKTLALIETLDTDDGYRLAELDDRVTSRISVSYRVRFDQYDEATIAEILERRARAGLGPDAVDERVLAQIAER